MTRTILKIYDFMLTHKGWLVMSFLVVTSLMVALMLRLGFNEDISAFLPLEGRPRQALTVYSEVSGSNRILAIVQPADTSRIDPDAMVAGVDAFIETLAEADTAALIRDVMFEVDVEKFSEVADFAYSHIPYFLTESDYSRIDSLLSSPDYLRECLDRNRRMLMFPSSGMLASNLSKDPLDLFSPVMAELATSGEINMEMYDGYIFTPDMSRAVVVMESPYGNSETRDNAALMRMLRSVADSTEARVEEIKVHFIGGPPIAVGNSEQIKRDSVLSIAIASLLIVLLLVAVFKSLRNILLIVISVAWGWLFAMAIFSVARDSVSLIVVGISSIILGIAVNYPLHLIAHAAHAASMRQTLREIVAPLIIGNVSTVGAFLALVPIRAAALRDLGIFSALILIGTILFAILYLPHTVKRCPPREQPKADLVLKLIDRFSHLRPERHKWLVWTVAVFTIIFSYFALRTNFDADMSHINYMTQEQKADMEYLRRLNDGIVGDRRCIYVVSEGRTLDEAMEASAMLRPKLLEIAASADSSKLVSASRFMPSMAEQGRRIDRWNSFIEEYSHLFSSQLPLEAQKAGYADDAFTPFEDMLQTERAPLPLAEFDALKGFNSKFTVEKPGLIGVVDMLYVSDARADSVKTAIDNLDGDHFCFDVPGMNSAMAGALSDNFNYIGWACGLIVFLFLWFSFGCIELALLAFLPMAISWVWILGIMGLTGIQFNIVNIILATFIFGQGDDYTIFITEGCCYEYAVRRRMLASYKKSIIISALIMFIGIGTLIVADHPALKSLAEVTIVGMFSVVLMAFLIPPVVFNWITKSGGAYRKRPLTLGPVMRTWVCGAWWLSQLAVGYVYGALLFAFCGRNEKSEARLRGFVTAAHRLDLRIMPGVKFKIENPAHENLDRPCIIVCNHQSMLDPMLFMAWSPKILIVANERSSLNPIVSGMFRWLRFYTIRRANFTAWKDSSLERDMAKFRQYVAEGYSIAFFPEGVRNPDPSIVRYHKGPFYLAHELEVDVLPVLIHGVNHIMPIKSFACYEGKVTMRIGHRITPSSPLWRDSVPEMTRVVRAEMMSRYDSMRAVLQTPRYFTPLVIDRYRYKGAELLLEVKRALKHEEIPAIAYPVSGPVRLTNAGCGAVALLTALVHPGVNFVVCEADKERREIARYAAEGIAPNLAFVSHLP